MEIKLSQILFQLINFSVVAGALYFLLFEPIKEVFEKRRKKIARGQKAAEENLTEQEKVAQMKAEARREAEQKATEIIKQAQVEVKKKKAKSFTEAKEEVAEMKQQAQADWEKQKKQLAQKFKAELVQTTVIGVEKLIQEKITAKKAKSLIDQEIEKLAQNL